MTGWIGVDLDGTLAEYHGFVSDTHIGPPVPLMVLRVKVLIAMGYDVRIFTARACEARQEALDAIDAWVMQHIGAKLQVTCIKDHGMLCFYDDRAIQIIQNTGLRSDGKDTLPTR